MCDLEIATTCELYYALAQVKVFSKDPDGSRITRIGYIPIISTRRDGTFKLRPSSTLMDAMGALPSHYVVRYVPRNIRDRHGVRLVRRGARVYVPALTNVVRIPPTWPSH